jgi:two-component system NtrC family sensor kinase
VIDYEVDFKRKDKKPVSVLLTGHVRYDQQGKVLGYEGINVDQSQRKQMEKELREAHDFLNKIIRSSPNAIMATDMVGNIIFWNRAAEETLGYKAEEVVGKLNIEKIYPEGMAREAMKRMRSHEYGGAGRLRSYPMVYVKRDGEVVEGNLSAAIIYDAQGKEIASVGIFVDLKERLEMERKLRETQEKLLQSEKLAAMGRLTSQIAHELNNPLYGIMNTLELLKTEVSHQSKRRKVLDMALSETVRLTDLLRKMLSFSKPEEEEKKPTDINTILDEILLLVGKQLQENTIRISSSFDDNLAMVYASRNQLRQVFLNMISNARDAMPDGGTLTVKTMTKRDDILIQIVDTGTGIREENIDKIFDSFFTTKESVKDVGLGLSVCYGFIQEHGGDIHVSSKWGSGTTFTISLPIYRENVEDDKNLDDQ